MLKAEELVLIKGVRTEMKLIFLTLVVVVLFYCDAVLWAPEAIFVFLCIVVIYLCCFYSLQLLPFSLFIID